MWDLDDWKDFSEILKNFAEMGFWIVGIVALLNWLKSRASP